ncbi:adenine phosphoribosyltransferase [Candidatus Puniceispirillum sp.]|uniref:adenine phosphoribosyltransferase n=1 Tax=Candidatus Puniceispirillum sp. TaxID=2026719 RepID=UPI001EC70D9B|nr:adenine phosphoribosyltransferase [Candidatus Puniceispirillum sp.]
MLNLDPYISKTPGFPKQGITFYDISPALEDPVILKQANAALCELAAPMQPDLIAGIDARGFLFSVPIATHLDCGVLMIRKAGKLPGALYQSTYALEYDNATLALQHDRNVAGKNIVLCDDLLATGGTLSAAAKLVDMAGGHVTGAVCLIELTGLKARETLAFPVASLQTYEF